MFGYIMLWKPVPVIYIALIATWRVLNNIFLFYVWQLSGGGLGPFTLLSLFWQNMGPGRTNLSTIRRVYFIWLVDTWPFVLGSLFRMCPCCIKYFDVDSVQLFLFFLNNCNIWWPKALGGQRTVVISELVTVGRLMAAPLSSYSI